MILKKMKKVSLFDFSCILIVSVFSFGTTIIATAESGDTPGGAVENPDEDYETSSAPSSEGGSDGEEDRLSCKEAKRKAISACSKGEAMSTVGNAMMPVLSAASAIGEEDTGKVVCNQGDLTKVMGAANAGIGTYCLTKVNSCISTCTQVEEACANCKKDGLPEGEPCPVDEGLVTEECGSESMIETAISECEERKQAAIAALAQGGILVTVGAMMTNACKDMKDDTEVEPPPQPPNAPSPTDNNSPLSVGVGPLHPDKSPGQFAPIRTTPGTKQAAAPPEDPFAGEDGNDPNLSSLSPFNSGPSSLSGMPTGGLGGPSGGFPSGESGDTDGNNGEGYLSGNYSSGGEGFLAGGSARRGGSSSRGGGGHSSYGGSGKKKFGLGLNGKDKLRAKRGISQSKSRHQSIFEIMSDLIQSFCREGQPVCE